MYHCAAGKDRTGVISAVVLGALDVDDELIVADYALSAERIDEIIATGNRRLAGQTLPPHGLSLRWIHHGPDVLPPGFPDRSPDEDLLGDEP